MTIFEPDPTIFKDGINFDWDKIVSHLRQQAYLVKGLQLHVIDARDFVEEIDLDGALYLYDFNLPVESQSFYFEG